MMDENKEFAPIATDRGMPSRASLVCVQIVHTVDDGTNDLVDSSILAGRGGAGEALDGGGERPDGRGSRAERRGAEGPGNTAVGGQSSVKGSMASRGGDGVLLEHVGGVMGWYGWR